MCVLLVFVSYNFLSLATKKRILSTIANLPTRLHNMTSQKPTVPILSAVTASNFVPSVFSVVNFPVDLLRIDIQVRSAAIGVSTDLYCVYREHIMRHNGRWSEWRHNGARSPKQLSSGFCSDPLRQRTLILKQKCFKQNLYSAAATGRILH